MNDQNSNNDQWDRYWEYGNFHSFSQVIDGNYKGAIADFWRLRFQDQVEGSHIVDIATGNGALGLLALEESERGSKNFKVSATDLANIDPMNFVQDQSLLTQLKNVQFHPRTPAESLPFEDASVDMVCSQFGLEYSDVELSVPEIVRVLKSGGNLALIAHHQNSIHIHASQSESVQLNYILDNVKIFDKAQDVLIERSKIEQSEGKLNINPTPDLFRKRELMKIAMDEIFSQAETTTNPVMLMGPIQYIREIFSSITQVSAGELLNQIIEAKNRVIANQRRLQDMLAAAKSESDIQNFQDLLERSGLSDVGIQAVTESDGKILGWQICASR
jgi:ubiquinone/menaquinone biosynthesis C-methylase UbiE